MVDSNCSMGFIVKCIMFLTSLFKNVLKFFRFRKIFLKAIQLLFVKVDNSRQEYKCRRVPLMMLKHYEWNSKSREALKYQMPSARTKSRTVVTAPHITIKQEVLSNYVIAFLKVTCHRNSQSVAIHERKKQQQSQLICKMGFRNNYSKQQRGGKVDGADVTGCGLCLQQYAVVY